MGKGIGSRSEASEGAEPASFGPPPVPLAQPKQVALAVPTASVRESIEDVARFLLLEVEALADSEASERIVADLYLKLALIAKDITNKTDLVTSYCKRALGHPLATLVLQASILGDSLPLDVTDTESIGGLALALGEVTVSEFEGLAEDVKKLASHRGSAHLAQVCEQLADAWMYRYEDPVRSAACAQVAMAERGTATPAQNTYVIAQYMLQNWDELARVYGESVTATDITIAARIALDHFHDASRALDLLRECGGNLTFYGSSLEGQVLTAGECEPGEMVALLSRRLALLETAAPTSTEVHATRFLLAQLQEGPEGLVEVQKVFADLAETGDWSSAVAHLSALRVATRLGDWKAVASQMQSLASLAIERPLVAAYQRRYAEVAEHHLGDVAQATKYWKLLFESDPTNPEICLNVMRLCLPDPEELANYLEAAAKENPKQLSFLRRAALVAENRLQDLPRALATMTACAQQSLEPRDWIEVARLQGRMRLWDEVAGTYRSMAQVSKARIAAPLLLMSGAIDACAGRIEEGIGGVLAALEKAPEDLASQAILTAFYREIGNQQGLRDALESLSELAKHPDNRIRIFRELGDVCIALRDPSMGHAALMEALEIRPDDVELLLHIAKLHDKLKQWSLSIEMRERVVDALNHSEECIPVLMRIGEIEEVHQGDSVAAILTYERARAIDPENLEVLRTCQRLYGKTEQYEKLLALLRLELALVTDDKQRELTLYLTIAKTASAAKEPKKSVCDAYLGALNVEPNNATALKGVLDFAFGEENYRLIVDVYSQARETAKNVEIICSAYEHLEDWKNYARTRTRHIALVVEKKTKARYCVEVAEIYEKRLEDNDAAIASYRSALEYVPNHTEAQAALRRLLEAGQHWRELVDAIEAELKTISLERETVERRAALLTRLGQVRAEKLMRPSEAAVSYEAVLRLHPQDPDILRALEDLYRQLGRDKELLRVKELQQGSGTDPSLAIEIAELRIKVGDIDGAIAAYQRSFSHNPSHRPTFEGFEEICLSHERWPAVMDLYKAAIHYCEREDESVYRLGDLYSRRGDIQATHLDAPQDAVESYLRVIELEPENASVMEKLRGILTEEQDWPALIRAHEMRADKTDKLENKVEALRDAATVAREDKNDRELAAELYTRLLRLEPTDVEGTEYLVAHYSDTEDWERLVVILEAKLASTSETDLSLLKTLAKISEERLHDEERAVRYYSAILEINPDSRRALDALARIYESTERWTEFLEVTRRLIRVTKDRSVKALLYFKCGSVTEAKFNNQKDAIRYYDAAIKTSPSCLPAVHGLRDLYLRRKDWPRVIETLENEVKLWPEDKERAGVFAQIGRIYGDELGQADRAMHYYESAVAVDPDCVPANRALFEHYFEVGQWERAEPLGRLLAAKVMRDGAPLQRSEFYRKCGIVSARLGKHAIGAESIVVALEIKPDNLAAVVALKELFAEAPRSHDFQTTFAELEKIYRRRDDCKQVLAHVLSAQGQGKARDGDLDAARIELANAIAYCPDDYGVTSALVELHESVREWDSAVAVLETFLETCRDFPTRVKAMMRQAELLGDGAMNGEAALEVLGRLVAIDPNNFEVHYRLSQELYRLERFDEAKVSIEKVIDLSAAPWANPSPERLARFYYYLGRILERGGDVRASASNYRRANDYDPGYAPPALALAMRSMEAGDQSQAETLLIDAAHAAMANGDKQAAVSLQRGLAHVLLKGGDREAAIEAYRGILEVPPRGAPDGLALAEIYATQNLPKAIAEVMKVVDGDLRHGPAYRVLVNYYLQANQPVRASRVMSAMKLLGYEEEADQETQIAPASEPLQQALTPRLRLDLLVNPHLVSPLGELFTRSYQQMSVLFPRRIIGENLAALASAGNEVLLRSVRECTHLFQLEPELYVGDNVPGLVLMFQYPREIVVLDRRILQQSEATGRFALGWAFEAISGRYATLLQLGQRQRSELGGLMRTMFLPPAQQPPETKELIAVLSPEAQTLLRRYEGEFQDMDMEVWMDGMNAVARRAGLLACDDLAACAQMLAGISTGEFPSKDFSALGTVFCGEDLFHFYLSNRYDHLRSALSKPPVRSLS